MGCGKLATKLGLPNASTNNVVNLSATFLPKPPIAFTIPDNEEVISPKTPLETSSKLPSRAHRIQHHGRPKGSSHQPQSLIQHTL